MQRPLSAAVIGLLRRAALAPEEVAGRAGLSPGALDRICRGDLVPDRVEVVDAIGWACGLTEDGVNALVELWARQRYPHRFSRKADATRAPAPYGHCVRWGDRGRIDVADVDHVLTVTWQTLGLPVPADGRAAERLTQRLLSALRNRPPLRAAVRTAAFHLPSSDWPDAAELDARQAEARVPYHYETNAVGLERLGTRLVDPDGEVAGRAAGRILRAIAPVSRLSVRDHDERVHHARELAAQEGQTWTAWADPTRPVERALVEDGIRRCYELAGASWPGRVVWAPSPWAAAVARPSLGLGTPLWTTQEFHPDPETFPWRFGDDLRSRLAEELSRLDVSLRQQIEALRPDGTGQSAALGPHFYSHADPFVYDGTVGAVDGDRGRRALRDLGVRYPEDRDLPVPNMRTYSVMAGRVAAQWLAMADLIGRACRDDLPVTFVERLAAYRDASSAGPWWPTSSGVLVADVPIAVHVERVTAGPSGTAWSERLHRVDGPAVQWRDGTGAYAVHGIVLPFELGKNGWSAARIRAERNLELRRAAIERLGWDRFVTDSGLTVVDGPVPDPGNPGNTLSLYDLPSTFERGARLLLCTNATPERDGTVRRFGLLVPDTVTDAVSASAWTFGVNRSDYERLDRAT